MVQQSHNNLSRWFGVIMVAACCTVASLPTTGHAATVADHAGLADALRHIGEHPPTAVNQDKHMDFPTLMETLAQNRVVFVGETHDRYGDHLNQLAVLQALQQRNPNLAIGVEWFQQPFQGVLNDYLAGKISESDMLSRSGYYERWRYDYRLLRPIVEFAKANHLPVIALNAQVELTRKVSQGGLEALTPAERAQLPAIINPPDASYRERLEKVFAQHSKDKREFDNFLLVQRIWDETMAHNIARYLQAHPQHQMVVFSGSGHISYDVGIPQDLARQMPGIKLATVTSSAAKEVEPGMADYFLLSEALDLPPTGKLGVMLDEKDGVVKIIGIDPGSAAEKAGLRKGDRLTDANGIAIHDITSLKLALAAYKPGNKLNVLVQHRDEKATHSYTITLQ
ncbi:ChaN family lipoprotein [Thiothrix nivea]|uniref:PDZ domain-containing protein n=1 Tax=Thiothrix nivea (strain ATCC 35100 / DSM 5205 / JP2) TaxID=870187 RepID=A0A656HCS5_THINJ|nr:ChaN family lipoprotein [Thiothrix nivea]EIJ34941.1 protein of unknown function DUF399 [Thiothrix nivea DSM 5205]